MIRGLPYDAELEYLESTGTQYVDTGVIPDDATGVEVVHTICPDNEKDNIIFGARQDSGNTRYWSDIDWGPNDSVGWGFNTYSGNSERFVLSSSDAGRVVTNSLNYMNDRAGKIDGVTYDSSLQSKTLATINRNIYLFGANNMGTIALRGKFRVYSAKISKGQTLVRDLIPVRVGSGASAVGYMYDRVSKRLFGNAGSGAFVLGPDKAVPILSFHRYASPSNGVALGKMGCTDLFHRITAKDYVQSGLVAMWDGIENAGWGVHDASATTWKDLVGSNDVTYTGTLSQSTGYWDDQCFRAVAKGDYSFRRAVSQEWLAALDGPITIDGVFTISDSGLNNSALLQIAKASENNDGIMFSVYNSFSIGASVKGAWGAENRSSIQVGTDYSYSGRKIYCAMIADATQFKEILYLGGIKMESASQARSAILSGTDTLSIGTYAVSALKTRTAIGEYNRFSIYSRALTADEIARNYNIDKARFGLP